MSQVLKNGFLRIFGTGQGRINEQRLKEYPLLLGKPEAVVVKCCDPRFQPAFDGFVTDIGIYMPIPIKDPGSIHDFVVFGQVATHKLGFCIDLLPAESDKRVIVLAHEDCKWCEHHGNHVEDNLREAAKKFARKFPNVKLEMYMAHMRFRRKKVFFTEVH